MSAKEKILAMSPPFLRAYAERIEHSSIAYRFAKGTFWVLSGALCTRFLSMISAIIVVRLLGKVHYGEFGMVDSTAAMFIVFAGFGLGMTGVKYVAEFRDKEPAKAGRIICISTVAACVTGGVMSISLIIFAPWLAEHTLSAPHLVSVLRIGAGIIFFEALIGAQGGVLSGLEAFRTIAQRNFILAPVTFLLMISGVYYGGMKGAVWALFLSSGIKWLLNHLAVNNEIRKYKIPLSYKNCGREVKILWNFSLPTVLGGIVVGPVNWYCYTMLVSQPTGYGEMGVYNAANQWFNATMFLPGLLAQIVLPILSERYGQNDHEQSKKILSLSMKVNSSIVTPIIIIGCLLSPYIMLIYGKGFENGWPTLFFALLTAGIIAVLTPIGQVIAASGAMWTGLLMNIGWAITYIAATKLSIGYGSAGLGFARFFAYVIHSIWTLAFAYKVLKK